jgi:hypothetical protein
MLQLKDFKSKNETLLELQQATISSKVESAQKKSLGRRRNLESSVCVCQEQVMWA